MNNFMSTDQEIQMKQINSLKNKKQKTPQFTKANTRINRKSDQSLYLKKLNPQ